MKVLIDTSVLVSAALRDRTPEAVILCALERHGASWIVSDDILTEYREVLAREKFGLTRDVLARWFDLIDRLTTHVAVSGSIEFPRDRKDAKFLACALAADADWFITSDRDFEGAQKLVNTKIVSVSLFQRLMCEADEAAGGELS